MNLIKNIKVVASLFIFPPHIKGEESYEEQKEKIMRNAPLSLVIAISNMAIVPLATYFFNLNFRFWEAEIIMIMLFIDSALTFYVLKKNLFKTYKSISNFYLINMIVNGFVFCLCLPFLGFMPCLYVVPALWIIAGHLIFTTYWRAFSLFVSSVLSVALIHIIVYFGWIEVFPLVPDYSVAYLRSPNYVIGLIIVLSFIYYLVDFWFVLFWNYVEQEKIRLIAINCAMEIEKNKTTAIITNFTDPIIVLDNNNKINMINPAATRSFGLNNSDLGKQVETNDNFSMANFKPIIKKDFTINKIDNQNQDQNFASEEIIIKANIQETTYKVITTKVFGPGEIFFGTMKIFYDLTREKIIDKLKSEFVTVAAHQLRTPLSAVKWAIKLILDGDVGLITTEQHKLLQKGFQSNEQVINVINDMLNVSSIEEGRFEYNFGMSDFRILLKSVLESLEHQQKLKNIQIKSDITDQLLDIYMDQEKISLVVQTLLENALNYSPEHGIIEITVKIINKRLQFTIKDNGIGIPAKDQTKLFSKFFRAKNAMRIKTEGTGLGLFISKNIINHHHGQITYLSDESKGTEFTVNLPISPNN
jgi:signal transduction histidine kinase